MGNVIQFPIQTERDWQMWEREIRKVSEETLWDEAVIEDALPKLKAHWQEIFESVQISTPTVNLPGPLRQDQIAAIKESGQAIADMMVARLKAERGNAFGKIIALELSLAYERRYGPNA